MKRTRFISLFAGLIFAGNLSYLATAQSTGTSSAAQNTENVSNSISITAQPNRDGVSQTITLKLPAGAQSGTTKVVLNGKNVTANFTSSSCSGTACETGIISTVDGIQSGKNTLYATVKVNGGKVASSRLRFAGSSSPSLAPRSLSSGSLHAMDASGVAPMTSYLPPSVPFYTNNAGGYVNDEWIQIGQQPYPAKGFSCSGQYIAIVLDHQTLVEQTSLQVSNGRYASPYCATSSADLSSLFAGLPQSGNYLIIVGTVYGAKADANLDTTPIGGTKYASYLSNALPISYLAIGVLGAQSGAYENYNTLLSSDPTTYNQLANAIGMLVEDMNGNYNFENADVAEYTVSPNDSRYPGQSVATVSIPLPEQQNGITTNIFTSGASPTGNYGGFWLLILQREDLTPNPPNPQNCTSTISGTNKVFTGCGTFYETGYGNDSGQTATTAYMNLAAALNGLHPDQLAILTTVGVAVFANTSNPEYQVASTGNGNGAYGFYGTNGTDGFSQALTNLGAPAFDPMFLSSQTSLPTFTYVTAPGLGNSLTGTSILSTSLYTQQGETGYVHGVMVKDIHGLYRPGHTSQETSATNDKANFTIANITSWQPEDWPGLSQGSNADLGNWAAYNYISYALINYKYIVGAQGSYRDDIHYYYTGSLNTALDYHIFDPWSLPMPNTTNGQTADLNCSSFSTSPPNSVANPACTWLDPVSQQSVTFTLSNFQTMQGQLHLELLWLYNTLQYMVSGSTNMKDTVASGGASTALALVGAAATVEGSTLQPPASSSTKVDVNNILSLVGGSMNVFVAIGSEGLLGPIGEELGDEIDTAVDSAGDMLQQSGTIGGGFTSGGGSQQIANADYSFVTTIGELANTNLQGQMSAGFDAALDLILSDWNKLSTIGPLIGNTGATGFYNATQSVQNVAVSLINQGTQRSMFMSLVPTKYEIVYWPTVFSGLVQSPATPNNPDMGWLQTFDSDRSPVCHTFYDNSYLAYTAVWAPSQYGMSYQSPDYSVPAIDYWVMSGIFADQGGDTNGPYADQALINTLFSNQSGGLNIPLHPFVAPGGPMNNPVVSLPNPTSYYNGATQTSTVTGHSNSSLCSYQSNWLQYGDGDVVVAPVSSTAGSNAPIITTVTITAPASVVLGESVQLQGTVTAVNGGVPTGNIRFRDGTTLLGDAPIDAKGNATFSISSLALGDHSLTATYLTDQTYNTSFSTATTMSVYANAPDLALSLSANTLSVSYGTASSAIAMQITSMSGLAGNVTFACSGLPVGMTCNFTPSSATLAAGSSATTSLTITGIASTTQAAAKFWKGSVGSVLCTVFLMYLGDARRRKRSIPTLLCLMLLTIAAFDVLTGCSGSSTPPAALQESGTKTVMVSATSGSITRETPLTVTIR